MAVCPVNAISREDGRVTVNEQECIGCKLCACVCPFGAIHASGTNIDGVAGRAQFTPNMPEGTSSMLKWEIRVPTVAVKCDLCAYDKECGPHCVAVCPTQALSYKQPYDQLMEKTDKMKKEAKVTELLNVNTSKIARPENALGEKE